MLWSQYSQWGGDWRKLNICCLFDLIDTQPPQLPPVSQIWWLLPGCLLCCSISRSLAVGWNYANVINTKSCWWLCQAGNELFILHRSTLTTLVSQLFWWKISTARFRGGCVCAGGLIMVSAWSQNSRMSQSAHLLTNKILKEPYSVEALESCEVS